MVGSRLQARGLRARFEPAQKLHITVAFLGWVDTGMTPAIENALAGVAARHGTFRMAMDRIGAFPNERTPRIVWLGPRVQGEAFRALAGDVRGACGMLGFHFEKPPVAHVTLARTKERAHLPLIDVAPIAVDVRELTLFESVPEKTTTRYERRAAFALQDTP